jgi:hypothetical protein
VIVPPAPLVDLLEGALLWTRLRLLWLSGLGRRRMGRAALFDDWPLRIDLDVHIETSSSLSDLGFGSRESSSGDSLDVSRARFRTCLSNL